MNHSQDSIVAVAYFAGDIAAPSELVSALPADCGAATIMLWRPLRWAQDLGREVAEDSKKFHQDEPGSPSA
jgi:hypothetical protein